MNPMDLVVNLHPEPIPVYKFKVYIQMMCLGFSKVTNLEESIETEPLQEGGVNDRVYSMRKQVSAEKTLILERGVALRGFVTQMLSNQLAVGERIGADILITVHKRDGAVGKIFDVQGAVVRRLTYSGLDAMSAEPMIETFELAYEKMEALDMTAAVVGSVGSALGFSGFY